MKTLALILLALPGFSENARLSAVAAYAAGTPVPVYCADTADAWRAAPFTAEGVYRGPIHEIYINPNACTILSRAAGRPTRAFAQSLLLLMHESMHAKGVRNEAVADCDALRVVAAAAITFYGFKPRTAPLRAVVRYAWDTHRRAPGLYQGVC